VIDGLDFVKRIGGQTFSNRINRPKKKGAKVNDLKDELEREQFFKISNSLVQNIRPIKDTSGTVVGRACISAMDRRSDYAYSHGGIVTVGGFRSTELSGIFGLLVGTSQNAARDVGVPVVASKDLAEWATEQADLVRSVYSDPKLLEECAATIRMCGGYTKNLPVAEGGSGWLSAEDILAWKNVPNEILLVHNAGLSLIRRRLAVALYENVLAVGVGWPGMLQTRNFDYYIQWPESVDNGLGFDSNTLQGIVIEAISKCWEVDLRSVVEASFFCTDEQEFERPIGTSAEGPVISSVNIIRKPF